MLAIATFLAFILLQTAVDKALQQEIERLAVKCSFHAKGCNWTATLNELQVTVSHVLRH